MKNLFVLLSLVFLFISCENEVVEQASTDQEPIGVIGYADPCEECCMFEEDPHINCPGCGCASPDIICPELYQATNGRTDEEMLKNFYDIKDVLIASESVKALKFVKVYYENRVELLSLIDQDPQYRDAFYSLAQDVELLAVDFLSDKNEIQFSAETLGKVEVLEQIIRQNYDENNKLVKDMDWILDELNLRNAVGLSANEIWNSSKN